MRYLILAMAMTLAACEEEERWIPCPVQDSQYDVLPIYIDDECSDRDMGLVIESVDKLNEMTRSLICGDIVEIIGTTSVDRTEERDTDTLKCFYEEPDWYDDSRYEGTLGWAGRTVDAGYIFLFLFRLPSWDRGYTLTTIMHELLHFSMVNGHSDNQDDVLYPVYNSQSTEYTLGDAEHFCNDGTYECVE